MATLVIMAAGMGSRYGGLKQIDPIGPHGEILLEYTVYDALRAGFSKVVFILQEELIEEFKHLYGNKIARHVPVSYVAQKLTDLPNNFTLPKERSKPLGTAHAIYCARKHVNEPFCAINADDYYGPDAFEKVHRFIEKLTDAKPYACCMVGFNLENTLTENGTVSRGVCRADENGMLTSIVEMTQLKRVQNRIVDLKTGADIPEGTPVSMNVWGFPQGVMNDLEDQLAAFLKDNPHSLTSEFYLPYYVDSLLKKGDATVRVLNTNTKWYGITYKEDKQTLVDAISGFNKEGIYPPLLFP